MAVDSSFRMHAKPSTSHRVPRRQSCRITSGSMRVTRSKIYRRGRNGPFRSALSSRTIPQINLVRLAGLLTESRREKGVLRERHAYGAKGGRRQHCFYASRRLPAHTRDGRLCLAGIFGGCRLASGRNRTSEIERQPTSRFRCPLDSRQTCPGFSRNHIRGTGFSTFHYLEGVCHVSSC